MAINMMCTNSRCINYWEDNCMKNLNEERIEINEDGMCETFEEGISPMYAGQEAMDNEGINPMATLGDIDGGGSQEDRDTELEHQDPRSSRYTLGKEAYPRDQRTFAPRKSKDYQR